MESKQFNNIIASTLHDCVDTLCNKAKEYATEDRLHNFKVAAGLQDCTHIQALGGMMCKHTVSVFDMINTGKDYPLEMWNEKIGDSINYLLLLKALVIENGK
jgi:hypothetical protein